MEKKDEYGDSWHMVRQNLLFIYKEALSSNCGDLLEMIQVAIILIKVDIREQSLLKGGLTYKNNQVAYRSC